MSIYVLTFIIYFNYIILLVGNDSKIVISEKQDFVESLSAVVY